MHAQRSVLSVVLLTAILSCPSSGSAASEAIGDKLNRALAGIEAAKISTGVLYDRVLPLSKIDLHDGTVGAPTVTPGSWRQMYDEMRRAHLREPGWPSALDLPQTTAERTRKGQIPIALLSVRYQRLHPDALQDGSVRVRDGHLELQNNRALIAQRVFAASALQSYTHRGNHVVFEIDESLIFTSDNDRIQKLGIDFDDGHGLRTVSLGEEIAISFGSAGAKHIRVQMTLADGAQYQSSFVFRVLQLQTPDPDDTLSVTATIPYNSAFGTGEAYVYLSDQHDSLTRPLVVVEGFDIDNTLNWDEFYAILNEENLIEEVRADGYDIVALNFTEGTDFIQKNAFALVDLLEQVESMIPAEDDYVLIGASMGGLVGRYALSYMETNAIAHRVRNFISFDTPHNGANVPLGMQYWLDFFSGQSADAAFLLSRLDQPASRQMLVYHHTTPPGTTGESDPLFADFFNELAGLGDYPSTPRLVSIVNGGSTQGDQGFAPGEQIILWEHSSLFVDITGNIWAVPVGGPTQILDGLIDIILFGEETLSVTVDQASPYDNAPGGYRGSMADMDSTEAPFGDIIALHDNHCFIPTVSALDLDTQDLFHDIAGDQDLLSKTPFDAVYFPTDNQPHIDVTAENKEWIKSELEPILVAVGENPLQIGTGLSLLPSFPNPFSTTTNIRFAVPVETYVRLGVFDLLGRRVKTLLGEVVKAGAHSMIWDGRDETGRSAPAGLYFAKLESTTEKKVGKLLLIR